MIKVNKQARCVLVKLTHGLEKPGDHKEFDNSPGAFMAVHVENIGESNIFRGRIFTIKFMTNVVGRPPVRGHGSNKAVHYGLENLSEVQCSGIKGPGKTGTHDFVRKSGK